MKIVKKRWGEEKVIVNNDLYCGKLLTIVPQYQCSVHYHKNKTETFHIIEGSLELEYSRSLEVDDLLNNNFETITLEAGDTYDIEPLTTHRFRTATSKSCSFMEFSTHHDDEDSYRLIESRFLGTNYYVDIDQTICITPENPTDYSKAEPIKERIDQINKLYDQGNCIMYWTARGSQSGRNYQTLTIRQLDDWGCKRHGVRFGKPSYDIFIDDKTIHPEEFFDEQ